MDENTFRKSIILHKAMTAIALNKLELPGLIDHVQYKLRVRRGVQKLGFQQRFPGSRKGSMVTETKNGIGESTSLGTPPPNWTYGRSGKEQVVTEYEVLFCNVHSLFFLHTAFSTFPTGRPHDSNAIANQHEILCSLHNTESKVILI
ncbi:MAG: hypothetical protein LBF25_00065 [Puniceicoccales bacterium]|nr:hypothetical protein [Puniceicoccales bacterium]